MAGPKRPTTTAPAEAVSKLNILVYGHTGSGKTHFIGSAAKDPAFGKILLLCPDPGALTLAFDADANRQIQVAAVSSLSDFDEWYAYLAAERPEDREFQTLAIDGFTDVAELALTEALDYVHKQDSKRDPNMPGVDHWNRVGVNVRRIIRRFRDLDMCFIATALAQDKVDALNQVFTLPSIAGKLAAELGAYVDIIGYLYVDQDKVTKEAVRHLRVERTEKIQAKDRTRRLPAVIDNPTLPGIMNLIQGADHPMVDVPQAEIRPKFKVADVKKK
jgi:hypothetical protein